MRRLADRNPVAVLAERGEMCRRPLNYGRESLLWKSKYGGMEVSEARRLRQREDENRQLGPTTYEEYDVLPKGGRRCILFLRHLYQNIEP